MREYHCLSAVFLADFTAGFDSVKDETNRHKQRYKRMVWRLRADGRYDSFSHVGNIAADDGVLDQGLARLDLLEELFAQLVFFGYGERHGRAGQGEAKEPRDEIAEDNSFHGGQGPRVAGGAALCFTVIKAGARRDEFQRAVRRALAPPAVL